MKVIVLAAGKGTRLHSKEQNLPKVLQIVSGRPLISYVLDNISFISKADTVIVVGYKKEMVIEMAGSGYNYAFQQKQQGTAHAVMAAHSMLESYEGDVLVVYGDMPLYKRETFEKLIEAHRRSEAVCTIATASVENPPDYGRVIRNKSGSLLQVIDVKNCSEEQKKIKEVDVGAYIFDCRTLFEQLNNIRNDNGQHEYYLTDMPGVLAGQGLKVNTFTLNNTDEIYGVNTPEDLKFCEKVLQSRGK